MARNYRPYACYWCMECGSRKYYKKKIEEFAVIIDNACTINCAKQSHIIRHFSYWFLSKVCRRWGTLREGSIVEGQLSGQSFTRSVLQSLVILPWGLANVHLQRLAPHGESLNHQSLHLVQVLHRCTWTQNRFVLSRLWPIPVLCTSVLSRLFLGGAAPPYCAKIPPY